MSIIGGRREKTSSGRFKLCNTLHCSQKPFVDDDNYFGVFITFFKNDYFEFLLSFSLGLEELFVDVIFN